MNREKIIEKRIKEKQKRIDKAMERKEKSIAYHNALNVAIAFVSAFSKERSLKKNFKKVLEYREKFYREWQNWYLENIVSPEIEEEMIKDEEITGEREEIKVIKEEEIFGQAEADFENIRSMKEYKKRLKSGSLPEI